MCAISIVAKLRELRVPMKRPINTKSSMSDTPVTISGFIIGILVTVITELLKAPRLILNIATAAAVPRSVAITAEVSARTSVF